MNTDQDTLASIQQRAADLSAGQLLELIAEVFGSRAALATSFGAEDQVLTDLIARHAPGIGIFTLDTGRLPQETYDTLDATRQRYGLTIEVLAPDRADLEPLLTERGPNFFRQSIEGRKTCCHVRKVIPLRRKLSGLRAWITGLRREQAVTRSNLGTIEWDAANGLVKINPLADWTESQVWDYIRSHDVPYNALHDRGYPSIGCAPCTRPVEPGQDVRAGRWWWEQPEHKECGLHLVDGKLARNGG